MSLNKEQPKYQYHVQCWGGFYNDEYQKIHGYNPGNFIFDTKEERQKYIDTLKKIEVELNARMLALNLTEGYCCNIDTVLHRIVEYQGKEYYSQRNLGINYSYRSAQYMIEWKWYPGFNDYPLGEDFDYENDKDWKLVSEWISGSFTQTEDYD